MQSPRDEGIVRNLSSKPECYVMVLVFLWCILSTDSLLNVLEHKFVQLCLGAFSVLIVGIRSILYTVVVEVGACVASHARKCDTMLQMIGFNSIRVHLYVSVLLEL